MGTGVTLSAVSERFLFILIDGTQQMLENIYNFYQIIPKHKVDPIFNRVKELSSSKLIHNVELPPPVRTRVMYLFNQSQ